MSKINLCIVGAGGRMGIEIARAVSANSLFDVKGAVEYEGSSKIGSDFFGNAGFPSNGCVITSDIMKAAESCNVILDFSGAEGTCKNIEGYKTAGKPLIVGSTGLTEDNVKAVEGLGKSIPLIIASNMSLGVNILAKLVEMTASILDEDNFDIEIFEAHHKYKKDAPSGTALTLGKSAAKGRNVDLNKVAVYAREGITGERVNGSIGFQVLRGGDIAGDHTVFFCGEGERLELTHRAGNRATFAKGALRAAKWLKDKPKGLYSMSDVLGL